MNLVNLRITCLCFDIEVSLATMNTVLNNLAMSFRTLQLEVTYPNTLGPEEDIRITEMFQ